MPAACAHKGERGRPRRYPRAAHEPCVQRTSSPRFERERQERRVLALARLPAAQHCTALHWPPDRAGASRPPAAAAAACRLPPLHPAAPTLLSKDAPSLTCAPRTAGGCPPSGPHCLLLSAAPLTHSLAMAEIIVDLELESGRQYTVFDLIHSGVRDGPRDTSLASARFSTKKG